MPMPFSRSVAVSGTVLIVLLGASVPAFAKGVLPDAKDSFEAAIAYEQSNEWFNARQSWQQFIEDYPDFERIDEAQEHLSRSNMQLLFGNVAVPQSTEYTVANGDTLGKIAKRFRTTVDLIQRRNNLKNHIIKVGDKLSIWNAPFEIYVDKSRNILMVKSENEVFKVYRVSTGAGSSTPTGDFKITSRLIDPVWYHHGVIVPSGTPENFLGTRWLGFDLPKYGIHGTHEPERIGQSVSAGCVRMRNDDVEELFSYIPEGIRVTIAE